MRGRLPTYENLRDVIRELDMATSDRVREVRWLEPSRSLAISRDATGRLEVFLVCSQLRPRLTQVREQLAFDTWNSTEGGLLDANRLVLAAGDQYDAAAAFIAIELLERGFATEPASAFAEAEPVIELVLTRARSENALVTGLAGELHFLAAMIEGCDGAATAAVVRSWYGWDRSSRDFQFGSVGVEVKTTTTGTSTHSIEGWYQVEPGVAADGQVETSLYLLSQGITWLPTDADRGVSIGSLIETIAARLSSADQREFVTRVRGFAGAAFPIDDDGSTTQAALRRPFMLVFERLYDLVDPSVHLPRSADLAQFPHMQLDSVRFTVQLPDRVRGDLNPLISMRTIVAKLHHEAKF